MNCESSSDLHQFFKLGNHPVLKAFVQAKWKQLARQLLWYVLDDHEVWTYDQISIILSV